MLQENHIPSDLCDLEASQSTNSWDPTDEESS